MAISTKQVKVAITKTRLGLIMRCFRGMTHAALATLLAIVAWSQEKPAATPIQPHIGIMRITGKAGIVSALQPSQMQLTVPENVIFTVHVGPSAQITKDGQPTTLSSIPVGTAVQVRGAFDMQTRSIEAASVELLAPEVRRLLEFRSAHFLKTWTSGIVTAIEPGSVTIQRMDGVLQTIQVGSDTSYVFHNQPGSFSWLKKGESIIVEFLPDHPPQAGRIHILGMVRGYS